MPYDALRNGEDQTPAPIEVPWEMKSVSTAETTLEWLDDRRLRLAVRHEVIAG